MFGLFCPLPRLASPYMLPLFFLYAPAKAGLPMIYRLIVAVVVVARRVFCSARQARGADLLCCCDEIFEFFFVMFRVFVEKHLFLPPKNKKNKNRFQTQKNEERQQQRGTARLLLLFPLRSFSVHFSCRIILFLFLFSRAEKEGRNTRAKRTAPHVPFVRFSFLVLDTNIVGRRSKSRRRCFPRPREFILARAELVGERVSQR